MTHRKPLVEALTAFQQPLPISFHVPGHKNGELSGLPQAIRTALSYDLTEVTGLDDLHYPEEAIRDAQSLLAATYGADESFFLVNGSTVGNLAMIHAVCKEGDTVIVQRNSHKSVFHALELAKTRPVYVAPEWDDESLTAVGVAFADIAAAVTAYPEAKAVVLTYPNYYGMATAGLKETIALCHSKGIAVLVDEAHGAHFQIGEPYPASALALGADVVVHSAHKTLPAMTMGSFLHVKGNLVNAEKIKKYLRMLQSSSPSYLIMASLDDARAFVQNYTQPDMRHFEDKREQFVKGLKSIPKLGVFESDDPLKLMLRSEYNSGFQLKKELEKVGIHAELADPYQVLLILPLLKQPHSYPFAEVRSRIKEAVQALTQAPREAVIVKMPIQQNISVPEISYAQLDMEAREWISYTKAFGRISAGMVIPYPPGVPLIVPGEKWTMDKLEGLMDYLSTGAQIQGDLRLEEKLICVLPATN
ncbi:aminotransferase class I/II-fold pyridoxal phosphate-dependent enzyme [Planococcus shenhongbingii]|uniref:Aminotransferase class I/II-fold pyridoxal phosphate-dependent enzyme n=1 Tax=Planococcus shenhongbingii TaxID=3058398 RepID=A0ABT8NIM6_9BACL|nr:MULTISPECIES: aminotransferase class I/II-fold pyridoxal phosphate-dependent enzyme [unclassified Planococcus (in: firmicutes)]MDN7247594.1 aminotransferase class I/II-fold pyridoxal phosphate-dependent enzyme [Planococcus sp. N017]WKA58632.1 aminotransferase class I/II-fold pyridoxal phosphate-dependent enzyme [Planococcus sp. N016]